MGPPRTTGADRISAVHGSEQGLGNRRDAAVAVVIVVCLLPISFHGAGPTFSGTFFLAEAVLAGMAARALLLGPRTVVSGASIAALCLLLLGLTYITVGLSGDARSAFSVIRASFDLFAFCVSIDNFKRVAERLLSALPWVGALLTLLLVLEFLGYVTWPRSSTVGYIGSTLRVAGPLGPGPTATILVCSAYLGLRRQLHVLPLICFFGLALSGSRAHYIAAGILLLVLSMSRFKKYHRYIYLAAAVVGALFAVYPGLWDRVVAASDFNTASQRTDLWQHALQQVSLLGNGPAGFSYVEQGVGSQTSVVVGYTHNQLLTLLDYYGLIGIAVGIAVIIWLWTRRRHRALLVAILASCVFGEFLIGPTAVHALGSMAVWLMFLGDRSSDDAAPVVSHDGS